MGLTKYGVHIRVHNTIYIICMYDYVYTVSQIIASLMVKMMKVDGADKNRMLKTQGTLLVLDIQHPIVGQCPGFETNTF